MVMNPSQGLCTRASKQNCKACPWAAALRLQVTVLPDKLPPSKLMGCNCDGKGSCTTMLLPPMMALAICLNMAAQAEGGEL